MMASSKIISARFTLALIVLSAIALFFILRKPNESKESITNPRATPRATHQTHTILVLDLDETMIHSPPPKHDRVFERPFIHEFLRDMHSHFDELVVFTAGTRDYASPILDRLELETTGGGVKGSLFSRRFYRDSCSIDPRTGLFAKDLRILGSPLDRVWILDNTPSAYALQPDRGVPISSFEGDPGDRELLRVAPLLKRLSNTYRE